MSEKSFLANETRLKNAVCRSLSKRIFSQKTSLPYEFSLKEMQKFTRNT
ncbi:hypothetical protein [Campylobacter troglodytis]|nr:hypothetical protein [Campylobacter troglodytis]